MFVLRSAYPVVRLAPVARQIAGLMLLLFFVVSVTVLALSMPEVTAEIGGDKQYTRMVPAPPYPNVSPTAQSGWG